MNFTFYDQNNDEVLFRVTATYDGTFIAKIKRPGKRWSKIPRVPETEDSGDSFYHILKYLQANYGLRNL